MADLDLLPRTPNPPAESKETPAGILPYAPPEPEQDILNDGWFSWIFGFIVEATFSVALPLVVLFAYLWIESWFKS